MTREAVEAFIASLPAEVLRAKGFFNVAGTRYVFQRTGQRNALTPTRLAGGENALVAIGLQVQLDPSVLDAPAAILEASTDN